MQKSEKLTVKRNDLNGVRNDVTLRSLVADGHRIGLAFVEKERTQRVPNQFTVSLLPLIQSHLHQTLFVLDLIIHFAGPVGERNERNHDFVQALIGCVEWKTSRAHALPAILIMKVRRANERTEGRAFDPITFKLDLIAVDDNSRQSLGVDPMATGDAIALLKFQNLPVFSQAGGSFS